MLGEMSPSDFDKWDAYSQVEPFGDVFILRGLALIWAHLVSRDIEDAVDPFVFMSQLHDSPRWYGKEEPERGDDYDSQAEREQAILKGLTK